MASFIEDYALISNMNTGALVSRTGSIDWFCAPRFHSGAVFAAILGEREHGRWLIAPLESMNPAPTEEIRTERSYRENTFVLQTIWSVGDASVRVTDFMPLSGGTSIVRNVEGLTGEITMFQELSMRFDNGKTIPWVTQYDVADPATGAADTEASMLVGMAGPNALAFRGDVIPEGNEESRAGTFDVAAGQHYTFTLSYFPSNNNPPAPTDYPTALNYTLEQWSEWSDLYAPTETEETATEEPAKPEPEQEPSADTDRLPAVQPEVQISATADVPEDQQLPTSALPEVDIDTYQEFAQTAAISTVPSADDVRGEEYERYRSARLRSLLVLRALISRETGGLVTAVTTALPEVIGGKRNWDYRYVWLRNVAMAMDVTLTHGHERETAQLRNWILRAVANGPYRLNSAYGVAGEIDDSERRLALPGYEGAQPVRSGLGSAGNSQGDSLGQVLTTFANLRRNGVAEDHLSWPLQKALLNSAVEKLGKPDRSMWEIPNEPRIFTHTQAMMWAALDAGVEAVTEHGLDGDVELWRESRDTVAQQIMDLGFNEKLNSFTQVYGGKLVDASMLQLPQVGIIAWDDPRMLGTVKQIEEQLMHPSGMIYRYKNDDSFDGFENQDNPHFGASLWLAEQYFRSGRQEDGRRLLSTILDHANDLGLMSSEYSFDDERMTGNFPHALAHIALIRAVDASGV